MTDDDMKLPPGVTCAECYYFKRCVSFIGISGDETTCDWAPSRFRPLCYDAPHGTQET
jgi:hypothetical protein